MDTVQVIYNVFHQQPEEQLLPACEELGVDVIVRVALDEGGLTGRITAGSSFPADDFRSSYFRGDRPAEVERHVQAMNQDLGISADETADVALRYVVQSEAVSTVIAGMRTVGNVERNVATMDGHRLTSAQLATLNSIAGSGTSIRGPDRPARAPTGYIDPMPNEKSITVQRDIPASSTDIFAVLSNPAHHVELDGSGFVQGVDHADRITGTDQSFRMNMSGDHMGGDYQTDNVVSGFDPGKLIAWKTAPAGTEPPGWEWVWELAPQGPESTTVSLTYDWAKVTDADILLKVAFPLVSQAQLDESLSHLAEAVSGS